MVMSGIDSTESGYSEREYGQVCGQITQRLIWLILSHNPETAVLQYKSAEIASGWPFFDVQKLRCGKQRNMPAAQFQDNFLSEESNSARYRMHGRPPVS